MGMASLKNVSRATVGSLAAVVAITALGASLSGAQSPGARTLRPPERQPLAITHVTVIDVDRGRPLPDQTVLVQADRIATVGPAAGVIVPPGMRVVDGRGTFLIPGLWDMHSHVFFYRELGMRLMIAAGVTGTRDAGGPLEDLLSWRKQ